MKDEKKKRKILFLGIFALLIIGFSYAFIQLTLTGSKRQVLTTGNLQLKFLEEKSITIENALPMYDEVGMIQEDEFRFQLVNESNQDIHYVINLVETEKSKSLDPTQKLTTDMVKFYLTKNETNLYKGSLKEIESENFQLDEGYIEKQTTIPYSLRFWLDSNIQDQDTIKNKSLGYKVEVRAVQEIQKVKHTLRFFSSVGEDPEDQIIYEDSTYGSLPELKQDGYKFMGWYTSSNGKGEKIESTTSVQNADHILYAYWLKLPNAPELRKNMLPIVYSEKENSWIVADTKEEWYVYDEQKWANAVTVIPSVRNTYFDENGQVKQDAIGTKIPESDMNAMWTWIPRYQYQYTTTSYGTGTEDDFYALLEGKPISIHISFIDPNTTSPSFGYKIPNGFTFQGKNLAGFWAGKFETSNATEITDIKSCMNEDCAEFDLTILPNKKPLIKQAISSNFYSARHMQAEGNPYGLDVTSQNTMNIHMAKNSEWGAIAYLSHSIYGKNGNPKYLPEEKEIVLNNCSTLKTGIAANSSTDSSSVDSCDNNLYQTEKGQTASTTGNITGVYDMAGGTEEYVMAVATYRAGDSLFPSADFLYLQDEDYLDVYNNTSDTTNSYSHALFETKKWYNDKAEASSIPWYTRGGSCEDGEKAGIFAYFVTTGSFYGNFSYRIILSPLNTE